MCRSAGIAHLRRGWLRGGWPEPHGEGALQSALRCWKRCPSHLLPGLPQWTALLPLRVLFTAGAASGSGDWRAPPVSFTGRDQRCGCQPLTFSGMGQKVYSMGSPDCPREFRGAPLKKGVQPSLLKTSFLLHGVPWPQGRGSLIFAVNQQIREVLFLLIKSNSELGKENPLLFCSQ